LVLLAFALVGGLAILYAKTESIDLREPNEIASLLRELKELDGRWDVDVLRASVESDVNTSPLPDRREGAEATLTALTEAAWSTGSVALNTGLAELSAEVRNKGRLVEKFKEEHAAAKQSMAALQQHTGDLVAQATQLNVDSSRLEYSIDQIRVLAPVYFLLGREESYNALYTALSNLEAAASRYPQVLFAQARVAVDAGRKLLDHKVAQMRIASQIGRLNSGPRLDNMANSFSQELEATINEKEIYRVFLITYAAALLSLVAWLGIKIRAANVRLEHRVRERTGELSAALKQLKESEAQLIQSEKLSSLGQMVAGVAHEINTPLAYVKNSLGSVSERLPEIGGVIEETERLLGMLQSGARADPAALNQQFSTVAQQVSRLRQQKTIDELQGLVEDGVHGTTQMSEIVGNLKDFSRLDRSKITEYNLNEGITSTLALAKHQLKTVTVEKDLGDIPFVHCSPSQINQVFLNLITNAAQALKRGRGVIKIRTRPQGDGVAVDIEDDGTGIPAEVLPKIFDPFFSTKDIGKGTGLGLSISYKIIQQHGGRIDVETTVGKGSRFTVYLPVRSLVGSAIVSKAA
jgi:signal transduction histidine kinase